MKTNIALTDMTRDAKFDATFQTYFKEGNYPARQTTESARLAHPDFLVFIDCIAEA